MFVFNINNIGITYTETTRWSAITGMTVLLHYLYLFTIICLVLLTEFVH